MILVIIIPTMKGYTDRFSMFVEQAKLYDKTVIISRNIDNEYMNKNNNIEFFDLTGYRFSSFSKKSREIVRNIADKFPEKTVAVHSYFLNWVFTRQRKNVKMLTTFVYSDLSLLFSLTILRMIKRGYGIKALYKVIRESIFRVAIAISALITSDAILSNTSADMKFYPNRRKYVYNSEIDRDYFKSDDLSKNNRIVFVGSLQYRKGMELLFEYAEQLKDEYELLIIGRNVYDIPYIDRRLKHVCKRPNVSYLENVNRQELKEIYENSFILISPSRFEGSPRTAKEALSMGLYVVATDIAGHRILKDGFDSMIITKTTSNSFLNRTYEIFENYDKKYEVHSDAMSFEKVAKNIDRIYKEAGIE